MKKAQEIIELTFRWYVWFKISAYGLGKIIGGQFHRKNQLPDHIAQLPISEIGSFDLAWTFFGYSNAYIWFIGASQLIGGILLLFKQTKLLGVSLLLPILLNIIVVDIFFKVSPGALLSAILYLCMCLFILYYNKETLIAAINKLMTIPSIQRSRKQYFIIYGIVFLLVSIILFLENTLINSVGR